MRSNGPRARGRHVPAGVTRHGSQATRHEPPATSHEPPATSIEPRASSHEHQATSREVRPGLLEGLFPAVALVGRPNVGKSTLFNLLARREVSITDARAGTTRDRLLHPISIGDRACDLVDTGGIGSADRGELTERIEQQIEAAVVAASVLVLVVDAKEGLTPLDRHIAQRLRELGRPVIVAANKAEGREAALTVGEFHALGFEPVLALSALHRLGLGDLEDALEARLPPAVASPAQLETLPKLAVVGRRNVGKSSFVNALARQERAIVSELPGTTRDALDLLMQKDRRRFWLIDTAGLRRMTVPEGPAEFFAQVRTERAMRRADVVLFMLAAQEDVTATDVHTARLIEEQCKPSVLVVNKWDLVRGVRTGEYEEYLQENLMALRHAPLCFTSATSGRRCWQTVDVALELYDLARTKTPTPALNAALVRAEREHEPPVRKGHKPRLLYGVQVGVAPPTFVVYCRHHEQIDDKYRRYLTTRLGALLDLEEIPLRIFLRDAPRKR